MYLSEACRNQAKVLWLAHVAHTTLLQIEQCKHMSDSLPATLRLQIAAPRYFPPT